MSRKLASGKQVGVHSVQLRSADLHRSSFCKFPDGVLLRPVVSGIRKHHASAGIEVTGGLDEVGAQYQDGTSDSYKVCAGCARVIVGIVELWLGDEEGRSSIKNVV
jgi:hypothetical protein